MDTGSVPEELPRVGNETLQDGYMTKPIKAGGMDHILNILFVRSCPHAGQVDHPCDIF